MSDQVFNLAKDAVFDLSKSDPTLVEEFFLGASWKNKGRHDTDIDLSAIVFNDRGQKLAHANFGNKNRWLYNHSMYHFGDDLTGNDAKTDADNEQIQVQLKNMPAEATHVFAVGSLYSGSMGNLTECHMSIRKTATGPKQIDANMLDLSGRGIIFGHFAKAADGTWTLKNISIPHTGSTYADFISPCQKYLRDPSSFRTSSPRRATPVQQSAPVVGMSWWDRLMKAIFG